MTDYPKSDYDEYPKTLPRDDFWGQVRRTIDGRRISEQEVAAIVESLVRDLQLGRADVLLDLACGNGALTARLFGACAQAVGVDRSTYLIEIAQESFERAPDYVFVEQDVVSFLRDAPEPTRFTKALCYGSVMFLPATDVAAMLTHLRERFTGVERLLLGNVPDRAQADAFRERNPQIAELNLDDPAAQAGRWWSEHELVGLASRCGWTTTFTRMQPAVFNTWYRYDAILTRSR